MDRRGNHVTRAWICRRTLESHDIPKLFRRQMVGIKAGGDWQGRCGSPE